MKIRQARKKDREAVIGLIKMYPGKLLQAHLPRIGKFFVAMKGDEIVGCCALEIYSKRLAEIRSLAVAKDHQGRGIATQLIERCLKLAKTKKVYEVLAITGANGLFVKQGFAPFNQERFALLKVLK